MTLILKVKRLTDTAKLPTYAHDGDACFDLYADSVTSSNGGTVFTPLHTKEAVFINFERGFASKK